MHYLFILQFIPKRFLVKFFEMDSNFGWDLVRRAHQTDIEQTGDVVVTFVHWKLLTRGLRSVGVGDQFNASGDDVMSELLPQNWKSSRGQK